MWPFETDYRGREGPDAEGSARSVGRGAREPGPGDSVDSLTGIGGNRVSKPWAILVVHGVGDTRPGATIDDFVATLPLAREGVHPDGVVEIRRLPEADPKQLGPAAPVPTFPAHLREARLDPTDGGPDRAVFAEVYWSDLSQVREGAFNLIFGLIRLIFSIRFFADQAAVMPPPPPPGVQEDNARGRRVSRKASRFLRAFMHLTSAVLCGPIAALSALLTVVLIVNHWLIPEKHRAWWSEDWSAVGLTRHDAMILGLGAATACFCTWRWLVGRMRGWSSSWTRFLGSLALCGLLLVGLVLARRVAPEAFETVMSSVADWTEYKGPIAGPSPVDAAPPLFRDYSPTGIFAYPLVLLGAVKAAFWSLSVLMLAGFIALLIAWSNERAWAPGLFAAFGSTLVQIGLWSVLIPGLALLTTRTLLTDEAARRPVNSFLLWIQLAFTIYLATWTAIVFVAIFVYWRRKRWVRKHPADWESAGTKQAIPRLIVNVLIFGFIILSGLTIRIVTLYATRSKGHTPWLLGVVDTVNAITVLAFPFVLNYFGGGLRAGLHVATDVINHFARNRDALSNPFGPTPPIQTSDFERQARIRARARTVLRMVLNDHDPARLTVISHSQGTVIAIDSFAQAGVPYEDKGRLAARLDGLDHVDLITMGSPISHLYQHYFPARYPSFVDPSWKFLKSTVRRWINLYRIDDYVGTDVEETAEGWRSPGSKPENVRLAPGGHTAYWHQPRVFARPELADLLPGTPRADLLPPPRLRPPQPAERPAI